MRLKQLLHDPLDGPCGDRLELNICLNAACHGLPCCRSGAPVRSSRGAFAARPAVGSRRSQATVADEGRTVLFSSHLLEEVERVADWVAMIHNGRIGLNGPLPEIVQGHRRLVLRFELPQPVQPELPGVVSCQGAGREWTVLCNGGFEELRAAASKSGAQIVDEDTPTLGQIFLARVKS